jgi:hypothetical protein
VGSCEVSPRDSTLYNHLYVRLDLLDIQENAGPPVLHALSQKTLQKAHTNIGNLSR